MSLPTSYSWPLQQPTASAAPPPFNPGPPVAAVGGFANPKQKQFSGQGIRFANVPGGKASNVITLSQGLNAPGVGQVFHVNTVLGAQALGDDYGDLSGVIRNRRRANFKPVPAAVRHYAIQQNDRFGNPITPGVGQYPPGYQFATIDQGTWNNLALQNVNYAVSRYMGVQITGTIYKMGGLSAAGAPSVRFERYLTSSGLWVTGSDMPGPKSYGAAALLLNGDIVVLGGSGSSLMDMTASFHYSAALGTWSVTPWISSSLVRRQEFQMVTLDDGRIFAPGGTGITHQGAQFTGSELLIPRGQGGVYSNPANEFWTGSAGIPLYPFNREGYTLTKLRDGTVLLLGGRDPQTQQPFAHALRYVPSNYQLAGSNGTWIVEPSMSFARSGHCAVVLDDGKVLVAGGSSGPGSNLAGRLPWQMGAQYGSPNAIPDAEIFDPGSTPGYDSGWSGSINSQVVGPFTGSDGGIYTTLRLLYTGSLVYGQGSWSSAGQMRRSRSFFSLIPLRLDSNEGRVLAAGGIDGTAYLSGAEVFDYEFRTWTEVTSMQVPSARQLPFYLTAFPSQKPYSLMVPAGETTGTLPNAIAGSQLFQSNG